MIKHWQATVGLFVFCFVSSSVLLGNEFYTGQGNCFKCNENHQYINHNPLPLPVDIPCPIVVSCCQENPLVQIQYEYAGKCASEIGWFPVVTCPEPFDFNARRPKTAKDPYNLTLLPESQRPRGLRKPGGEIILRNPENDPVIGESSETAAADKTAVTTKPAITEIKKPSRSIESEVNTVTTTTTTTETTKTITSTAPAVTNVVTEVTKTTKAITAPVVKKEAGLVLNDWSFDANSNSAAFSSSEVAGVNVKKIIAEKGGKEEKIAIVVDNGKLKDLSSNTRVSGYFYNAGDQDVTVGLALTTGEKFVWFESVPATLKAGVWTEVNFDLTAKTWKNEASSWENNTALTNLNDIRKILLLVYNKDNASEIYCSALVPEGKATKPVITVTN